MSGTFAKTIVLSFFLVRLSGSALAGPEIREYEDAVIVSEGDRTAVRFSIETDEDTGLVHVQIATLFDPYGDPYLTVPRESNPPAAIDWGVPHCQVGDRQVGPFVGESPHRTFERWSRSESDKDKAELSLQRAWLDPSNGQAFMLETADITVHAQQYYRRAIDLHVHLVNVCQDRVVIPANPAFLVRFDAGRPRAGFRTPENDYRSPPFRYEGPWLAGSSMSLTRMKLMGVALFSEASTSGGGPAQFTADRDGILEMSVTSRPTVLQPGESTDWGARVFCYADDLPARSIQDSYLGFLGGRNW